MQKLPSGLIALGLFTLFGSIVLGWFIFPENIKNKIENKIQIRNGSSTFEKWANLQTPIFFTVKIFNVSNPFEVENGHKPKLKEIGPYVYEQKRHKFEIKFSEDEKKVRYKESTYYIFRKDLSNGSESDIMTFINVPFVSLANTALKLPKVAKVITNMYILRFHETLFVNKTVGEMLFNGYKSPMFSEIQGAIGKKLLVNNTFALFQAKNGSDNGEFEINTGVNGPKDFGQIISWKNKTNLEWWQKDSHCNYLKGSDGGLFSPFVKQEKIYIYSSELCRSIYLKFSEIINFRDIDGYRFILPSKLLEDPRESEENKCFCNEDALNFNNCAKRGAFNINNCRKGAPIVMSTPHFLNGHPDYLNETIGLTPERTLHETFIDLEPITGVVLQAKKRIQINIQLKKNLEIDRFNNVPNMVLPLLWIEESFTLSEESTENIKSNVLYKINLLNTLKWVALGISFAIIILGLIIAVLRIRRKNYL